MANKHATLKALFDAIAVAIRTKTGSTDKIIADNFPDAIEAIDVGGGIENVEQAAPSISVSSSGIITCTSAQTAGYVSGGTKTATHSLSNGDDGDFLAKNIKSGVTIFGVKGTYEGESNEPRVEWISSSDISSTANSVTINTDYSIGTLCGFALVYNANYENSLGLYSIVGDESSAEVTLRTDSCNESASKTPNVSGSSITIRDSGLHYYYTTSLRSCIVIYTPA